MIIMRTQLVMPSKVYEEGEVLQLDDMREANWVACGYADYWTPEDIDEGQIELNALEIKEIFDFLKNLTFEQLHEAITRQGSLPKQEVDNG